MTPLVDPDAILKDVTPDTIKANHEAIGETLAPVTRMRKPISKNVHRALEIIPSHNLSTASNSAATIAKTKKVYSEGTCAPSRPLPRRSLTGARPTESPITYHKAGEPCRRQCPGSRRRRCRMAPRQLRHQIKLLLVAAGTFAGLLNQQAIRPLILPAALQMHTGQPTSGGLS